MPVAVSPPSPVSVDPSGSTGGSTRASPKSGTTTAVHAMRRSIVVEWLERHVPGGRDCSGLRGRALAAGAPTGQVLVLPPRLHVLPAGGLSAPAVPARCGRGGGRRGRTGERA